ncbi:hypothetical protein [Flaviaesturariibacter terrae]
MKNILLALTALFLVASADAQKPKTKVTPDKNKTKMEHMKAHHMENDSSASMRMDADSSMGNKMGNQPPVRTDSSMASWSDKSMIDTTVAPKAVTDSSARTSTVPSTLSNSSSNQARSNEPVTNPAANRNINPGDKEVKVKEKPGKTKIKHNKEKTTKPTTSSADGSGGY